MVIFWVILGLKSHIPSLFPRFKFFFFPIEWFLPGFSFVFLYLFVFLSPMYCGMFCCLPIMACFIIDLLRRIVVSLTVGFFIGFYVDSSDNRVLI